MLLTAEWTLHVLRGELFLTVCQGPWWGLSTIFFFFFCQSESGGPSAKALERPAGSRKHKVITRLPFREQVPQTNSAEETEAFKVALHESPQFSGDSLEKLLLIRQSWTCVQDFGAARLDFYRLILKYLNITAIMYRSFSTTFLVFPDR